MTRNRIIIFVLAGALGGFFAFMLDQGREGKMVQPSASAPPTVSSSSSGTSITPPQEAKDDPSEENSSVPERTPPEEPSPLPLPAKRIQFPPPMPPCLAENPEELQAAVGRALESGDVEGAESLFEELAVCRGDSALAIGSMYDPAQPMSRRSIEPDARRALHFYLYAAALGKDEKVLRRLSAMNRSVQSDPDLVQEIADLAEALKHHQH